MRARLSFALSVLLLFCSPALFAKDIYLSIAGSANGFFTDARIFNPSYTKDITISARYLPAGNVDNSNVQPRTITIPKRTMAVYDDVTQSLFGIQGATLGAVRLVSDDDFIVTQRAYADLTAQNRGTLGQLLPGMQPSEAIKKGVLVQLKSNASFRTNWGGANPNGVVANIHFELYDKNNQLAAETDLTLQPYGVFSPTNIAGFFGNPNRDLSDAWISFDSDQPIFVYGSVVDNVSTDPTYVPPFPDTGEKPEEPPPPPQPVVVTIVASDFEFSMTQSRPIKVGDQVKFVLSQSDGSHGFRLGTPSGQILIDVGALPHNPTERLITVTAPGNHNFVCTNSGCGFGHFSMVGTVTVNP